MPIVRFHNKSFWWTSFFFLEETFPFILGKYCYFFLKKRNTRFFFIFTFWLFFLCFFLSNNYFFQSSELSDICLVDNPTLVNRFFIIYTFWNTSLYIKNHLCFFFSKFCSLPSISYSYSSALWLEREIYDLFGVYFFNHPDLRRILTDYGFNYHPFDKTFAITGYVEVRYSIEHLGVFYNSIEVPQEYRFFNFISPWEKNESSIF